MTDRTSSDSDADILRVALGAPARQVLEHAQSNGPRTGWKDGFLSSEHGFCPANIEQSRVHLQSTLGAVWLETCQRLPALIRRGAVGNALRSMPLISGSSDTIPDQALWAASVALSRISAALAAENAMIYSKISHVVRHTNELPITLSSPHEQLLERLRPESGIDCPYHDLVSAHLLSDIEQKEGGVWHANVHSASSRIVELVVQAQEMVIQEAATSLVQVLLRMKRAVEEAVPYLRRTPAEKFVGLNALCHHLSLEDHFLGLPIFQVLHAVIGEPARLERVLRQFPKLRKALPLNIRAFLAAIENHHNISKFVAQSSDMQLAKAWQALETAYHGPGGILPLYLQKRDAWRSCVSRLSRPTASQRPPWDPEDDSLMDSPQVDFEDQPFTRCNTRAKVISRSLVDTDPNGATALITLATPESDGLPFENGDRLLVMPLNPWSEVEKVSAALGLENFLDVSVPLYGGTSWDLFARQLGSKQSLHAPILTVRDVLRYGQIGSLTKEHMNDLDAMFHGTSPLVKKLLASESWPVMGTLGDVLQRAIEEVSPIVWDTIFDLEHLSWLTQLVSVGTPQLYCISSPALMGSGLPSVVKIMVERVSYDVPVELDSGLESTKRFDMTSQALHPDPDDMNEADPGNEDEFPFLVGTAPGLICTLLFLAHQSQERFPFREELERLQATEQMKVFSTARNSTTGLDSRRLLASIVLDQGQLLWDMLMPVSEGGLGGQLYISGSIDLFHSVVTGLRRALYNADWSMQSISAEAAVKDAVMNGRIVLDIHPDPMATMTNKATISLSQLAQHTGHRTDLPSWVAYRGQVYDFTDLHQIQPWHAQTMKLYAGLAITEKSTSLLSNGSDIATVLPAFYVGSLASKPAFATEHMRALYGTWVRYLHSVVETLTAFCFEANRLLERSTTWFGPENNRQPLFDFLRLQHRLLSASVSSIFGLSLQELHLRTAFAHVIGARPDAELPDVMGIIARATNSPMAAASKDELTTIMKLSESTYLTPAQIASIHQYCQAATAIELHLLEGVREEASVALEMIETEAELTDNDLPPNATTKLLCGLERIACRYESFWQHMAIEGLGKSCVARTRLRAKYDIVQRATDGTYSSKVLPHPSSLSAVLRFSDQAVSFADLVDQAMHAINEESLVAAPTDDTKDLQTTRHRLVSTAYDAMQNRKAMRSLASFLGLSEPSVRRLSQLPSEISVAYIMSTYGRGRLDTGHVRTDSAANSVLRTMDEQLPSDAPRPRLIRRRTNASSISSSAPRSIFSTPAGADTPYTMASVTSSPQATLPLQLTLRARDRSSSRAGSLSFKPMKGPLPVAVPTITRAAAPGMPRRQTIALGSMNPAQYGTGESYQRIREQQPRAKLMPTLLPSPLLPDMVAQNTMTRTAEIGEATPEELPAKEQGSADQGDVLSSSDARPFARYEASSRTHLDAYVAKEAPALVPTAASKPSLKAPTFPPLRNKIDQVYSFSISDGLAAGEVRSQHIDSKPAGLGIYDQAAVDHLADEKSAPGSNSDGPRHQKRTRTVERIFSHSREELHHEKLVSEMPLPSRAKTAKGKIDRVYTFSVFDGNAAGRPRAKHVSPTTGHWTDHKVAKRREEMQSVFTHSKTRRNASIVKHDHLLKITRVTSKVDRLYSFSASDGPIARKSHARAQGLTDTSRPCLYDQAAIDKFASRMATVGRTSQPLARSDVQSVYTHSRSELTHPPETSVVIELKPCRREVFPTLLMLSNRRFAHEPCAQSSKHLWRGPQTLQCTKQSDAGIRTTLGYVGMWMSPGSRIANAAFETAILGTKARGFGRSRKRYYSGTSASAISSGIWTAEALKDVARGGRTLGYVGLWMSPPSMKINEDFELSRQGVRIPALSASPNALPSSQPMDESPKSSVGFAAGLWPNIDHEGTSGIGLTKGYVGMWMRPASRIGNEDFEYFESECKNARQKRNIRKPCRSTWAFAPVVGSMQKLWDPAMSFNQESLAQGALTLGSVGMWMSPPSRKINHDFEQHVVNATNFLLRSKNDLLNRMAHDFQQISAELTELSFSSGSGKTLIRSVMVLNDSTVPIIPERCQLPASRTQSRTLGQVGLWMYPPSKKRNVDFEAYRAVTDAIPDTSGKRLKESNGHDVKPMSLTGAKIAQLPSHKGYTIGYIGMWMDPPSLKTNEDFDMAKDTMQLAGGDPEWRRNVSFVNFGTNLPVDRVASAPSESSVLPAAGLLQLPVAPEWATWGDSPTLPAKVGPTPVLTPDSAESAAAAAAAVAEFNIRSHSRHQSERIDFDERMRKLSLELEDFGIPDSYLDGATATGTPTSGRAPSTLGDSPLLPIMLDRRAEHAVGTPEVPSNPWHEDEDEHNEEVEEGCTVEHTFPHPPATTQPAQPTAMPDRRPPLEQIKTSHPQHGRSGSRLDENGLEILSAVTYTPSMSSQSASSGQLSTASVQAHGASRPIITPAQSRPQRPVVVRGFGSAPTVPAAKPTMRGADQPLLSSATMAPTPPPLRSQSVKTPAAPSRISSVRNMWERRASLVINDVDSPTLPAAMSPLRARKTSSRTRSPPEPLKLVRSNMVARSNSKRGVVPGFEMVGSGSGTGGMGERMMHGMGGMSVVSPLSPEVRVC
ncbi:uncharacterized protein AB675_11784 [Cyphellophora attinorum]|uniref:Cytochrome b5 heme-binding domain-containing protein n=1 Tax=Cyphellophora attinorum TaxID=1664694 RepID=A0A0N1H551_9EURO|nr:uncharacterized protein AB675_11784 [Phialophora attinorum]KPI36763.1 hypothetical protein AB675_11784 [Phialophora attinorum]